jgi:hypothetical protein
MCDDSKTRTYLIDKVCHELFENGTSTFRKSIVDIGLTMFDNLHVLATVKPSAECDQQRDAHLRSLIHDMKTQKEMEHNAHLLHMKMKDEEIQALQRSFQDHLSRFETVMTKERDEHESKIQKILEGREEYVNSIISSKVTEIKYLNELKDQQRALYEESKILVGSLQSQVTSLRTSLEELNTKNNSIACRSIVKVGQIGEEVVYDYISSSFSEGVLSNTSKQSAQGDMHFNYKGYVVLIEVKNKDRIKSDDIVKFVRDVKENNSIFGGVFVSIKRDVNIPCHTAYDIEWLDKKPVIYIKNFEDVPETLYIAIKSIIFYLDSYEKLDAERSDDNKELNKLKQDLERVSSVLTTFYPILDEAVKQSKRAYESLESLRTSLKDQFAFIIKSASEDNTLQQIACLTENYRSENGGRDPTIKYLCDAGISNAKLKKLGGIKNILASLEK